MTKIGAYRLVREADAGVRSVVWRAEHEALGTTHALKWLRGGQPTAFTDALLRAARIQARVVHPNVVRATDAGRADGRAYAVEDWVDGPTLSDRLDTYGALPPAQAVALVRGVARGVQALHAAGVVHRDLKPSNVLLMNDQGRLVPKVTDLSLAKELVRGEAPRPTGLSAEFRTLGTPEYMAPEQVESPGTVDPRADLWSLGVLLYELLTNEVPFEGSSPFEVLERVRRGDHVPLGRRVSGLPARLHEVIAALLATDRDARMQSCAELLAGLDDLGEGWQRGDQGQNSSATGHRKP